MIISTEYLRDVFANNRIVYASLPITTGWRFLNWLQKAADPTDKVTKKEQVIDLNIRDGRITIAALRAELGCTVIDPTQLEDIKLGWAQEDYYRFWDAIIKDVATEIVFLDGWECSTGCCHELISGLESNKPMFNQAHEPLTLSDAIRMIECSRDAFQKAGFPNPGLEKILNRLHDFHI